ncbi:DEAD/DEAH box helicase [Tichowtungia aerotolerans]|uniref:DEAD/DEAH box helicase n=1 Tax=Tichowtungia aerotolerans TaxID=2697043 RepID=A0A6P1MBC3_9BACT|nr:DEAD/DEAH box helicase [Tichowtungia aerotolerans]QHI68415.1 DEAD/DEAH box helicase [Tichowtungia aerotolerans]
MKFSDLGLSPELLAGIEKLGFETPTPVQGEVIPYLLDNDDDVVALAQTGTGKTAAFGLPILEQLDLTHCAPQALILCPTRELCMQIARDLQSFASCMPEVKVLAVYGGADIRRQLDALSAGVQIIVATPGRMLDILRRKRADFSFIERVVLDEADEMLNMGFEEDIEAILSSVNDIAQTLLFSATMPKEVAKIARNYMEDPHEITVGSRNAGAENVSHDYYVVHAKDRYRALRRIVDFYPRMYGIVFCRTRMETQQVSDHLRKDGYSAEPLHGDLTQMQRDSVMKKFRDHHVQILVATDVAARGLDVNDLTHVINYNLPDDLAAYTHRSGRTGRAGKEGISVSIIHMREHHKINRLQKALGKKFTQKPVPTGEEIARVRLMAMAERVRDWTGGPGLIDNYLEELTAMLADLSKEELIKRFVSIDMHRMLLFYRDAPDLNVQPSERQSEPRRKDGPRESGREKRENHEPRQMTAGMVELVMNVGKVNGVTPKKLMAMVNVADRDKSIEIGRINIVKMQSYFEVPRGDAMDVIDSFTKSYVDCEGRQVSVAMAGNTKSRPNKPKRKGSPSDGKPFDKFKDKPRKGGRGQGGPRKRR